LLEPRGKLWGFFILDQPKLKYISGLLAI